MMIEFREVTKKFGDFTAVNKLNLSIGEGEFFGLLGPNGAGKTTSIGMLSTVLLPTEGEIFVAGQPLSRRSPQTRKNIAVVTQEFSLRQDMTVEQAMKYQGLLYRLPRNIRKERTEKLLAFAGLTEFRGRTIRHLSGGMKRKLMICRALLTEPEILLLDEPTAGMDALARRQMWSLLKKLQQQNLTILLTTHFIDEAQFLCDRVALLSHGRLDVVDRPQNLIAELGCFAVDEMANETLTGRFFPDREQAIEYLSGCEAGATLRNTTLEDVFLSRMGEHLQ